MKAHIIYSPDHQLSLDNVEVLVKSCDKFNISYELIKNVTAFESRALMTKYGVDKIAMTYAEEQPALTKISDRDTVRGCFMSHYLLWLRCIEADEPFLILEHDAVFVRSLPMDLEFDEAIDLNYSQSHSVLPGDNVTVGEYIHNDPCYTQRMRGTDAYIIKPIAAKKAVDLAHTVGYFPSDAHLNGKDFKLVQTNPNITILSNNNGTSLVSHARVWNNIKVGYNK